MVPRSALMHYFLFFLSFVLRHMWLFVLLYAASASANPIRLARDALLQRRGQTAQDFLVTSLPGLSKNFPLAELPVMHAGQLLLDAEKNSHYFFWKFADANKNPLAANKTIFWFNGGPGCLSMDGALMESGPLRVNKNSEVDYNEGSWHKLADVVYVDQPAGTGFSYGLDYDSNMDDVQEHFVNFLDRYYEVFPEETNNEIILAGESYAGQYIPYFGSALLLQNDAIDAGDQVGAKWNLRGLMIGNGAISGDEQSLSYVPFLRSVGLLNESHPRWTELLRLHEQCQNNINKAKAEGKVLSGDRDCNNILQRFLKSTPDPLGDKSRECVNIYDYTLRDTFPACGMNWPPPLSNVYEYLANLKVRSSINVHNKQAWKECNNMVHSVLEGGQITPLVTLLPGLLERMEVLLFWGLQDIICNYMGGELMVRNLKWGGQRGYTDTAVEHDWFDGAQLAGTYRTDRNLTFVNVKNASHMVPFDQPTVSRALFNLFMHRFEVDNAAEKPAIKTKGLFGDIDEAAESATVPPLPKLAELDALSDRGLWTSQVVRMIELVVIVVVIWALCALYNRYYSKPVSIIRTSPSILPSKKKTVQWADDLENVIGDLLATREGFTSKAYNLLRKPEPRGSYAPEEDIELERLLGDPASDKSEGGKWDPDDIERKENFPTAAIDAVLRASFR